MRIRAESLNLAPKYGSGLEIGIFGIFWKLQGGLGQIWPNAAFSTWHMLGIKSRNFKLRIRAKSQNLTPKYGSGLEIGIFGIFRKLQGSLCKMWLTAAFSTWHKLNIKSRNFKLRIRAESLNLALKYGSGLEIGIFGIFRKLQGSLFKVWLTAAFRTYHMLGIKSRNFNLRIRA